MIFFLLANRVYILTLCGLGLVTLIYPIYEHGQNSSGSSPLQRHEEQKYTLLVTLLALQYIASMVVIYLA